MGIMCIIMALRKHPDELHLWGYDRVESRGFGSAWAQEECLDENCPHDWPAEKQMIKELTEGRWLGEPVKARTIWHQLTM